MNTALRRFQDQFETDDSGQFVVPRLEVAGILQDPDAPCASRSYGATCPRCGGHIQFPRLCGRRRLCPICARIYAKRVGRSLYGLLKAFEAEAYRELVFTTSSYVIEEQFPGWSRGDIEKVLASRVRATMLEFFGPGIGFVVLVQGWHSREPLKEPYWHVHVLMPCLRWDASKGKWRQLSPWLPDRALDRLRAVWGHRNGVEWLWVWQEYWTASQEGKFRHKCTYVSRRAILDINEFCLRAGVEEFTPDQSLRFTQLTWSSGTREVLHYGFLANGVAGRYLVTRGSSRDQVKGFVQRLLDQDRRLFCPHCHYDVTAVWTGGIGIAGWSLEETDLRLVVHRKLVWNDYVGVAV